VSASGDVSVKLTIQIRGKPYRLRVTRDGFSLAPEGKRRGVDLPWSALADEDAQMMSALHRTMKRVSGRHGR
jgi:hypothetical protein